MKSSSLFIALLISFSVSAQEELINLNYNPVLVRSQAETGQQMRYEGLNITFLIDTLELPFLDDFSTVKLHRYVNAENLSFLDSSYAKYRANEAVFDSLFLVTDTSYSFYYSSISGTIDTLPNPPIIIQQFHPDSAISWNVGIYWHPISYYYNNGIKVDSNLLLEDTIFYNQLEPIYVAYDSSSLWIDNNVFINNSFHIGAPTIGVATFDGIDSLGHAYNITQANSYGVADYLTSKPINLLGKTDVVLSFYYQQQGLGNKPEEKDSLVLEFYIPDSAQWVHAWSISADTSSIVPDFAFVDIPLIGDRLAKGFKFRFKNYATLSGSLDHWNIDYVYLNEGRVTSLETTSDLGFKSIDVGITNTYSSMPWHQYLANTSKYTKTEFNFTVTNRSGLTLSGENTYQIIDLATTTTLFSSTVSLGFFPSFLGGTTKDVTFPINGAPYNYTLPTENVAEKIFEIVYATNSNTISGQEQNIENDTVKYKQVFSSYYAYDDGIPERAYTIIGAGSRLAYGFELEEADTLKSILIHFTEMFKLSTNSIKVMIWNEKGGLPNDTLYVGYSRDTIYVSDSLPVRFMRFYIGRETIIPAGKFFIGFEQSLNDKMYIGFDMNLKSQANLFYDVGAGWKNTSFVGSLLLRPDFGKANIPQIYSTQVNETELNSTIRIYPNPANDVVTINEAENAEIQVINITGQLIYSETNLQQISNVDVSFLNRGVYILRIIKPDKPVQDHKLIITR